MVISSDFMIAWNQKIKFLIFWQDRKATKS